MTEIVPAYRIGNDDFQVEFEVLSPLDIQSIADPERQKLAEAIQMLDGDIDLLRSEIRKMDAEIDRLTNHADGIDYAVAVVSGIITGLIDSFFVGETEIDIKKVQAALEKKYHAANDDEYRHKNKDGKWTDSATYHRLDDLAHHPTVLGLVAAILVRYFRLVIFIDGQDGKPHIFFADKSANEKVRKMETEQLVTAWIGAVLSGLFMWLANIAEKRCDEAYDGDMPEALRKIIKMLGNAPLAIEFLKTADVWIGHMMSDVSTSQGIPGVFLSLLKELSALPIIRDTSLPGLVDDLYKSGTMNLSKWGGVVFTAAKKQAMPIIINEVLVRGFYFVRRLITEYQAHQNFKEINWNTVVPLGNRTIVRMMTIASGTFTAVDLADAAIRGAINSGGTVAGFAKEFILRVNFVGVGRFAIAVATDVGMGIKRNKLMHERIDLMSQQLSLLNAKVYYRCAQVHYAEMDMLEAETEMWQQAADAQQALTEVLEMSQDAVIFITESLDCIYHDLTNISAYRDEMERLNPGITKRLLNIVKY